MSAEVFYVEVTETVEGITVTEEIVYIEAYSLPASEIYTDTKVASLSTALSGDVTGAESMATSAVTKGDSRAVSLATVDSTNLSTGNSKATSLSVIVSSNLVTGNSKALSLSVVDSTNLSTGDSKAASLATSIPATSSLLQVVYKASGELFSSAYKIPIDDSIPQIDEGHEMAALATAVTPKSADSTLMIDVVLQTGPDYSYSAVVVALFQVGVSDALAVAKTDRPWAIGMVPLTLRCFVPSGSLATRTYTIRVGCGDASTACINGTQGARYFGGRMASTLTVSEFL